MKPKASFRKTVTTQPAILFGLGAITFAIPAKEVDEIRDMTGLLAAGVTAPSQRVKFRLVREGKTYWVIDGAEHFRMLPSRSSRVLVLRNSRTAVLVERIDRMTEIGAVLPLPRAFHGEERTWYRGLALVDSSASAKAVPVVNADSFTEWVSKSQAGALR